LFIKKPNIQVANIAVSQADARISRFQ